MLTGIIATLKKKHGSSLIELVAGSILFMLLILAALDLYSIVQGASLNSALAKDAARAASRGMPGKLVVSDDRVIDNKESPYKRAMEVIQRKKDTLPYYYEISPKVNMLETLNEPIPMAPYGGPVSGNVSVETTIVIHPQFILGFLKIDQISLKTAKSCPYTWIMRSQPLM